LLALYQYFFDKTIKKAAKVLIFVFQDFFYIDIDII